MIPAQEWEWFGSPGHFIASRDCRFHLATKIGPWWVSTVGEYLPGEGSREIEASVRGIELTGRGDARRADYMTKIGWSEIGSGRTYETMVFRVGEGRCDDEQCDCGMPQMQEWGELDSDGYNTRGDAQRGHHRMCAKWAEIEPGEEADAGWT